MPYKTGELKGELTTPEIRKLIKAHNILVSIKIPKGSKREDIIALIKKNGYEINHEKQALIPKVEMKRKPKVDMKKADKVLPKPKTKEEKAASKKVSAEKKKEKEDKIKAEGVKQGAALQRIISKKKKNTTSKKEDEVRPKSKIGRPRVDPTKIKVIEPKKKTVIPKPPPVSKPSKGIKIKKPSKPNKRAPEPRKMRVGSVLSEDSIKAREIDLKILPPLLKELSKKWGKLNGIDNANAFKKYVENTSLQQIKKDIKLYYKDYGKLEDLETESNELGGAATLNVDDENNYVKDNYNPLLDIANIYRTLENNKLIKYKNRLEREKKMNRKKILKNKNLSNNKKGMDFKIGDTYLFKIKTKEFEGIATKINDKSITMLFRWVNDRTLKKPIKKEDIIERLGGTDFNEDLMERYNGIR